MVVGFEPTNDGVKVRCLYHLATPQCWSRVGGLNSQLTAYKAVTLPIELTRRRWAGRIQTDIKGRYQLHPPFYGSKSIFSYATAPYSSLSFANVHSRMKAGSSDFCFFVKKLISGAQLPSSRHWWDRLDSNQHIRESSSPLPNCVTIPYNRGLSHRQAFCSALPVIHLSRYNVVGMEGLEPSRPCGQRILSPHRLPVPTQPRAFVSSQDRNLIIANSLYLYN